MATSDTGSDSVTSDTDSILSVSRKIQNFTMTTGMGMDGTGDSGDETSESGSREKNGPYIL